MTDLVEKVAWAIWPDETRPPGPATHDLARLIIPIVQEDLLREMMEKLTETPLIRETEAGVPINQTQGIFWAIKFVKDTAKSKGLDIDG